MFNIAVVIPTYQRVKKLERCINSILNNTYKRVTIYIYADNCDFETLNYIQKTYPAIICQYNNAQYGVVKTWNRFTKERWEDSWDIMCWLVDDVELYEDCLEKAVTIMQTTFADTDGVVGLTQECPGHPEYSYKPYGQVLLGRKFIQRYEPVSYQVCAPCYFWAFQDEEMYLFSSSMKRFYHCLQAKLKHYHPGFIPTEMDSTHNVSRRYLHADQETYKRRRHHGLVWGATWQL